MSMIGKYARLTPAELDRAISDPLWAREFVLKLGETDGGIRRDDTDKAWDAIDFLLRRIGFPVNVVYGEKAIPAAESWGYGPPRYLPPARVRAAAEAFLRMSSNSLVNGVTPADLDQAEVYPGNWEDDGGLDYVTSLYECLVSFFKAAAHAGDALIIWID